MQSQLLRDLVATASNAQTRDRQIGRTLFNLLIPVELEAYLTGSGEMQIELDAGTAAIPWELLNTDALVYGGSNVGNGGGVLAEARPLAGQPCSVSLTLPPLGVVVLKPGPA